MIHRLFRTIATRITAPVYIGRSAASVPPGSWILFPVRSHYLCCGLIGILEYTGSDQEGENGANYRSHLTRMKELWSGIAACGVKGLIEGRLAAEEYMNGETSLSELRDAVLALKGLKPFRHIFQDDSARESIQSQALEIRSFLSSEDALLDQSSITIESSSLELVNSRLVQLRDIAWWLERELLLNMEKVESLLAPLNEDDDGEITGPLVHEMGKLNLILNNLDRLEIRGRDSAGICVMVRFSNEETARTWKGSIHEAGLGTEYDTRSAQNDLVHRTIKANGPTLFFIFKTARELGHLGDNVLHLREEIAHDRILRSALSRPDIYSHTIAHTRWASVGAISEPNCHPLDGCIESGDVLNAQINVVLNGDIDNYQEIKQILEDEDGIRIPLHITTDTKVIPLWVAHYLKRGNSLGEAFRHAVSDFKGSHAIALQSDLEPHHLYLAQRGSGQAIFVGIGRDSYVAASEVYGVVEQTPRYIKLEGERERVPGNSGTQGQILILDSRGGLDGIQGCFYDGHPVFIPDMPVKTAQITTRDIDREGFPHYFLKEVTQAPDSVRKTIRGKATILKEKGERSVIFNLGEEILPARIINGLRKGQIKNIYLVGQGTAGVAAEGIAMLMTEYLARAPISVRAKKASELSGFCLDRTMSDTLVLAVTQSGTTTDTNKAVDLVRSRGAFTMAIVNRRDSDIATKVDGIFYTSDGRDIEMSVASTKAFYSQIVAGCILSLRLAQIMGTISDDFIASEMRDLMHLPSLMTRIINEQSERIAGAAAATALPKRNWAVVGSGPNKVAADEIRIKLSELCYKTLPADVVEDRKHIDLSAEPLIIVCAAGNRETVLGDVIKDTAIFKAHQATVVCIASEGEDRFEGLADALFCVPNTNERLAPILNTLAGHLWGYYVARAMDEEAHFFKEFKTRLHQRIDLLGGLGEEGPDMIYDREIRLLIKQFERVVMQRKQEGRFDASVRPGTLCNLALACRYALGQIPVNEMENHFGPAASHGDPLILLCQVVEEVIDQISRPIDAIKHQAKTVTVGTSRLPVTLTGTLFDMLHVLGFAPSDLSPHIISQLKQIQNAVISVEGATLYHVTGLDPFGLPTPESQIRVVERYGISKEMQSRVERDHTLRGTKRAIVKNNRLYVGIGVWDKARIIIFPLLGKKDMEAFLTVLHVSFCRELPLDKKIRALGMKYNDIMDLVTEWNIPWDDTLLEGFTPEFLLTHSEEEIVEAIRTGGSRPVNAEGKAGT
ncbi:MAG: SIS domain-containing protein [bacterium]